MKFVFPKNLLTPARWDILTVLLVSLTVMVGLIYGVIFAYPQVLPLPLQLPTKTPTLTSPVSFAARATQPFPTFPPEWTAVFATRHPQSFTSTPIVLASLPAASSILTFTTNLTASPVPGLSPTLTATTPQMSLTASLAQPTPSVATGTPTPPAPTLLAGSATPAPAGSTTPLPSTPEPTASLAGYPAENPLLETPFITTPVGYP